MACTENFCQTCLGRPNSVYTYDYIPDLKGNLAEITEIQADFFLGSSYWLLCPDCGQDYCYEEEDTSLGSPYGPEYRYGLFKTNPIFIIKNLFPAENYLTPKGYDYEKLKTLAMLDYQLKLKRAEIYKNSNDSNLKKLSEAFLLTHIANYAAEAENHEKESKK